MPFHNVRFYTQWFVNVPLEKLKDLTSLKWCHYKAFRKRLLQLGHSKCKLIVPSLEGIEMLRVKIIGDSELAILRRRMMEAETLLKSLPYEKKENSKIQYWYGHEPFNLHDPNCLGTMVSCWGKHPLVNKLKLSYELAAAAIGVFSNGYGNRATSACEGLNMYFKNEGRDTQRPHPTPMVASAEIGLHQYFNNKQKNDFYNAIIRKHINAMAGNVLACAYKVNNPLMQLVGDICDRLILTSGHLPRPSSKKKLSSNEKEPLNPPVHHVWSRNPIFGFVNTSHVDTMDCLTQKQKKAWSKQAKKQGWSLCEKLLSHKDFCLPTTCGYQFCYQPQSPATNELIVQAYFSMEGLGLAIELEDGIFHHFMAAMFSHRTCLPVCRKGFLRSCCNSNGEFLIVGWGNSGGNREVKAQMKKRNNPSATVTSEPPNKKRRGRRNYFK